MRARFLFLTIFLGVIALAQGCATDHRTIGTQLDDENIELSVRKAINDDNRLGDDVHVNITSFNGTVLLTGEATTAELRDIVVSRVRRFEGVKRVVSEINVAEPVAFANRVHDSWITGQVKAKMLHTPNLKSTRIKVVTENSVVYLMGLVNHQDADLATEDARTVSGVKRVVKLFEYLD
jgi:osmotically-inducible protein OsmY